MTRYRAQLDVFLITTPDYESVSAYQSENLQGMQ